VSHSSHASLSLLFCSSIVPSLQLAVGAVCDHVVGNTQPLSGGPLQARLSEVGHNIQPTPASVQDATRVESPANTSLFLQNSSHDAEDGAVIRNIEACRAISQTVQTSLGPYGRNKIVINHLSKMILTSDAATILRELDVVHPAAKLLVMASQQQEAEMGDATNLVIVLAGELLKKAEELLRMGLKTSDIVQGYEKAQDFALKCLEGGFSFPLVPLLG